MRVVLKGDHAYNAPLSPSMNHPEHPGSGTGELKLDALEPLDLRRCNTVSDIVDGMSRCSFGARMLGEVAQTLTELAQKGKPPTVVYEGKKESPVGWLLQRMVEAKLFDRIQDAQDYGRNGDNNTIVAVGRFSERDDDVLFRKPERTIFINDQSFARPGQMQDGFFPDAVFSDPRLIMPILDATLKERLHGIKDKTSSFVSSLYWYEGIAAETAKGAETFKAMVEDKDCEKFFTLSGAMTIAQMYHVIEDMIHDGMIDSITSTGALMAHGLMPGMGLKHYKYNPVHDDIRLARHKMNRVTDTIEPETNFDQAASVIDTVLRSLPGGVSLSTSDFHRLIGQYLAEHHPHRRGILKSAYEKNIPVFVPAFSDSELGNDSLTHNEYRKHIGMEEIFINPQLDQHVMIDRVKNAERLGIFTIGGGVPRNHIQNIAPLMEILNERVPGLNLPTCMFSYGVRIAPDATHTGHLSGCTYSENKSWRKFHPDAKTAEIKSDATIVWPLIVKYVMETREA